MAHPELRHLRYLVAVVDAGSFTGAARALNVAQPALSQQIQQLERLAGATLLERRPRVRPTPAGEALLASARRVLAEISGGIEDARRALRGGAGQLTVGFASSVVFTPLRHVFRRFLERAPEVRLVLRELHSSDQVAALGSGAIDIALTRDVPRGNMLRTEPLSSESLTVLLCRRHSLTRRKHIRIEDLAPEPLVLFPQAVATTLYHQIERLFLGSGHAMRVSYEAQEWHTISGLVEAGLGVSIAPGSVTNLKWPGISYRPLHPIVDLTTLSACYDEARLRPPVIAFLELVREVAAGENPGRSSTPRSPGCTSPSRHGTPPDNRHSRS